MLVFNLIPNDKIQNIVSTQLVINCLTFNHFEEETIIFQLLTFLSNLAKDFIRNKLSISPTIIKVITV